MRGWAAYLAGLNNLEVLSLSKAKITDAGMMHLRRIPGLKDLRLDGTKVSNASMDSLKGMVALKNLDLSDALFSWAGTAELHHLLPGTVIHNSPLYYSPGGS